MSERSDLFDLGWTEASAAHWQDLYGATDRSEPGLRPARVIAQQRGRLRLASELGEVDAEISGRLQYLASGVGELPVVGDWVAAAIRPDEGTATVHDVLPRGGTLIRKAPDDRAREAQVLAANVDTAWLVTSLNRDFNPRRIERTLALVREGGVDCVIVLSKCDLVEDVQSFVDEAVRCAPDTVIHRISAVTGRGVEALADTLVRGRTVAVIGSSGVGKSTLINRLIGRDVLLTSAVRADDDRGRHTTTHRELLRLPGGASLIDTPGLREIALWSDDAGGIDAAFPELEALFARCRFHDCHHESEPGCAVREALEQGTLDPDRLASHRKLKREAERVSRRHDAKGRHLEREEHKRFTKAMRRRVDKRDRT